MRIFNTQRNRVQNSNTETVRVNDRLKIVFGKNKFQKVSSLPTQVPTYRKNR